MAPDQGSLGAARKLLKTASWPTLQSDEFGLVWGECQGSGASPYRVIVSEDDAGYKCTCPSRKFPCKHSLALMWMRAEATISFTRAEPPDWVHDWLGRRRGPAAARPQDDGDGPKASIALAAQAEEPAPADPKAEARAAAQRERLQTERETSILRGLDELDLWLGDQLQNGLAAFAGAAVEKCRLAAQRLVDAKAGGLAAQVEELSRDLFARPEAERASYLLSAFSRLHLITQAYRRQNALSGAVRADVRQIVGWTASREALLAQTDAIRAHGRWMVLATFQTVQPDKLRRIETWLGRCDHGEGPEFALLMDFVPVSAGVIGNSYSIGESFEATLVFYPSGWPLRALIGEQSGPLSRNGSTWQPPGATLEQALVRHETAIAQRPWLERTPFAIGPCRLRAAGDVLYLVDGSDAAAVKLRSGEPERTLLLTTLDKTFGIFDGSELVLTYAETPVGRWPAP